ncbi:UNVERIFIED_CONTAM: hypothetical protein FKN15_048645 [Acipenser sinensis]
MKSGRCWSSQSCFGRILSTYCCCCVTEGYSVSTENGRKSESLANLQPHTSLGSIPTSSPGPKRSGNTLKKWLTSPVRRLSSGKADSTVKKIPSKHKKRDVRKSFDLGSPKPGENESAPQDDSADEKGRRDGNLSKSSSGMQSGGEEEPDEESHPPLPPPMKIIENDPQEEMPYPYTDPAPEARQPTSQPRNPEMEQKAKALRGRMFVLNELIQTEKDYVKDLGIVVEGFMKTIDEKGFPEDVKGKDKIVFGNIHQIYDWHKDFFLGELEKCLQDHDRLAELFIKHDFLRFTEKAGIDCLDIEKAVNLMCLVPKRCNDMMNLGRLQGFEGKLTAQGKLLQQDTFYVAEQDSGVLSRSKERRVFLFEQIVIFSELLRKGSSIPGYQFKKSIKMSYLSMDENIDNDPCKFALYCRGSSERVTLQAANPDIKQAWVYDISQVLDTQRDFLNGYDHHTYKDRNEQGKNDIAGCNGASSTMMVTQDYNALKENEICVIQGEMVHILAINQQNMFLVYRPANNISPAAEGWVPGYILGPMNKTFTENAEGSIKKSLSWHTLRMRKRAEKESSGKSEAKVENGSRKPKEILSNKVPVKLLNPNFIQEVAPEFLIPLADVTCSFGQTVVLCCKISGRPKPNITLKGPDQNLVVNNIRFTIDIRDTGEILLKICNLMPQDTGIYTCVAVNQYGTASSSASIKVQGVPTAPSRPEAQERGCTSVILRWLPPASTGHSAISSYTVEYREEDSLPWQQCVVSTLDTFLLIEDLTPGGQYQFRVSASNPWGISAPSEPSNIVMLSSNVPRVKLIDFGDAIQITSQYYIHPLLGNPEFAAPELIQGSPVSLSTDIWSLGVLAYVMLSGVSPFLDESVEETCMNICRLDFSFPDDYFWGVSHAAKDFIKAVLQVNSRKRPTASTCLQHPWLHSPSSAYSKNPLDTSRLASFTERRRQQNDVCPVTNIKSFMTSSMGHTL